MTEAEIKQQICDIGKRIYDRGMVASNDGNISVKISENEFLCTPTGVSKGFMTPEYICKIDSDGKVLEANEGFRPSSEIKMHLRVYKERPDVKSVVHAHPMYATSFAIAGIPLVDPIMPEAVISLGAVPIAEYGTPSTEEIPDAVSKYLQDSTLFFWKTTARFPTATRFLTRIIKWSRSNFTHSFCSFQNSSADPTNLTTKTSNVFIR